MQRTSRFLLLFSLFRVTPFGDISHQLGGALHEVRGSRYGFADLPDFLDRRGFLSLRATSLAFEEEGLGNRIRVRQA
ncbi:hypothetical protein ACVW1C_008189 [Bradyrhizobium sp. USDA 4011]